MAGAGNLLMQDGISFFLMEDGESRYALSTILRSATVMGAVTKRVKETPSLIDALPGGFWSGVPDEEADDSEAYGVLTLIGETVAGWITRFHEDSSGLKMAAPSGWRTRLQVSLIGRDYAALEAFRVEWERVFGEDMEPLGIEGRRHRGIFNQNLGVDFGDVPPSPSGYNVVVIHWEVEIITNRRVT